MDRSKIVKAAEALIEYQKSQAKKQQESKGKDKNKNALFEDETDNLEFVYLVVTSRHYFADSDNMIPHLIELPSSLWKGISPSILAIVPDPQRSYKDLLQKDKKLVDRVVGISKLKGKFKKFSARRELRSNFDLVLGEKSILKDMLPLLGKTFYSVKSKIPVGIDLPLDDFELAEKNVEAALGSTTYFEVANTQVRLRVGSTLLKPQEIADNIEAVMKYLEKLKPWDDICEVGLKTVHSPLLPLYESDVIFREEDIGEPERVPTEAEKRRLEEARLDLLLEEVASREDIEQYNREVKRLKREHTRLLARDDQGATESDAEPPKTSNSD